MQHAAGARRDQPRFSLFCFGSTIGAEAARIDRRERAGHCCNGLFGVRPQGRSLEPQEEEVDEASETRGQAKEARAKEKAQEEKTGNLVRKSDHGRRKEKERVLWISRRLAVLEKIWPFNL